MPPTEYDRMCEDYQTSPLAGTPTLIGWGWSASDDAWLSRAIRVLTRPGWGWRPPAQWSHMFIVFAFDNQGAILSDADQDGITMRLFDFDRHGGMIHEALNAEGWCCKHARKLDGWLKEDPDRHHATIEWLDIPPEVVAAIWKESTSWIGTRSYAWQQLVIFGLAETVAGRALRRVFPHALSCDVAEDRVICSEGACRLVGERWPALDMRRFREPWAAISPQEAYHRYLSKFKRVNADAAIP